MATLATMKGLWSVIQSMSLTESNRRWLADKLIASEPIKSKTKEISYPALDRALEDVKKGNVFYADSVDDLMNQLNS